MLSAVASAIARGRVDSSFDHAEGLVEELRGAVDSRNLRQLGDGNSDLLVGRVDTLLHASARCVRLRRICERDSLGTLRFLQPPTSILTSGVSHHVSFWLGGIATSTSLLGHVRVVGAGWHAFANGVAEEGA
ncbi:MAG: hypothetical protein IPM00_07375 [Tetrasphaera sp.]|nr:hypothetical protein [Tetrasphaera sp.]